MNHPDITNPIIPVEQIFYHTKTKKVIQWDSIKDTTLDYQAIAAFLAIGFMLDDQTFFKEIKVCKPATQYKLDKNKTIIVEEKIWEWDYHPKDYSFNEVLDEFTSLFETLVKKSTNGKSVLLPISGGLDSRTLFVPIQNKSDVTLSSYDFEDGFLESETGRILSERFNIPFYTQIIPRGYLWNKIESFHQFNRFYTDFTHPRQVAAINQLKGLGDVILLGHWGDVFFDKQTDSEDYSYDEQLVLLNKKMLKPGGSELAEDLWKYWGINGSFESYISDRFDKLYNGINIDHPSARIRAFKSLYWAPRWTSPNLSIFKNIGEIILPYYNDKMCKFICTIPEYYLSDRKIQIEYIKRKCPDAASIAWQKYHPMNLYQYQRFNNSIYYPKRAVGKLNQIIKKKIFNTPDLITRNWELQFLGESNFLQLKENLLNRKWINEIIPKSILTDYLEKFQLNPVKYSHPISMLLTISVFMDWYKKK